FAFVGHSPPEAPGLQSATSSQSPAAIAWPAATVSPPSLSTPSPAQRDDAGCRTHPTNARATPEEHAMLQLAIEAYQTGRRAQAKRLFEALTCQPEVGAPARFMARLLVAATPNVVAPLPRDRAARTRRLVDETEEELEEHPDLWAQSESLASADL